MEEVLEELAVCEDDMMEEYLEEGRISLDKVQKAVADRQVFPCYFGSALHSQGVEELLDGLDLYIKDKTYPAEFGAKVYKIARDNQGNRLTYLKVTGGRLKVKDVVEGLNEKINQIRIYSGEKFEAVQEVEAGRVCAVTGLENTRPGQGIGAEEESDLPVLEPVLTYQILLPDDCDVHKMLLNLKILEEEEPELHIVWEEQTSEIHVQLMGDVQIEMQVGIIGLEPVIELGGERLGRGHDGVLEFLLVLGEPGTVVIEPDAPEYVDGLIGIASEHDAYSL